MTNIQDDILGRLQKARITDVLYSTIKDTDTWVSDDESLPDVPAGTINGWYIKFDNKVVLYLGENILDPPVFKSLDQCLDLEICTSADAEAVIGRCFCGIGTERDFVYRYLLDDESYLHVDFDFVEIGYYLVRESISAQSNVADITWTLAPLPEKE